MYKYVIKYDILRYGIVGVLTVILDFLILYIFYTYFNIDVNISITLSYFLASISNYFMHKYFTFRSQNKIKKEIWKFIIVVIFSYILTIFLVNFLIQFNITLYYSKLLSLIFSYILVYIISKLFIYKEKYD